MTNQKVISILNYWSRQVCFSFFNFCLPQRTRKGVSCCYCLETWQLLRQAIPPKSFSQALVNKSHKEFLWVFIQWIHCDIFWILLGRFRCSWWTDAHWNATHSTYCSTGCNASVLWPIRCNKQQPEDIVTRDEWTKWTPASSHLLWHLLNIAWEVQMFLMNRCALECHTQYLLQHRL